MTVKLNHYWTIIPDRMDDYRQFIIDEFVPGLNNLGMHTVAGWTVLVGAYAEIIFESVASDLEFLEKALRDRKYKELNAALLKYVKKYNTKVLSKTGRTDAYTTDIREDTVKFNQSWNVVNKYREDYEAFSTKEFYPCLEKMGITVAGEWEVLIGDGPHIICEGRAADAGGLIASLRSRKFMSTRRRLKNYVADYTSRILTFHIQKVKGYKSACYNLVCD